MHIHILVYFQLEIAPGGNIFLQTLRKNSCIGKKYLNYVQKFIITKISGAGNLEFPEGIPPAIMSGRNTAFSTYRVGVIGAVARGDTRRESAEVSSFHLACLL